MNLRQLPVLLSLLLVILIVLPIFLNYNFPSTAAQEPTPDVYVGIDVAHGDYDATKQLIDEASAYTNLFVIGCTGVSYNPTRLNEICQYIYDKNMSFIVFTNNRRQPTEEWIESATTQWGNRFLGMYVDDEIGGKQLDQAESYVTVASAANYSDAENQFNTAISGYLSRYPTESSSTTTFTSDYALYWFDYKAGYDTVFAEFGWNYSRQLNIALCRGAATAQNKDWGVMITWTYTEPPYLESGPELYNDMVLAYQNGAKYIIVFDTDENYNGDILQQEHLDAIQQFWQYVQENPRTITPVSERSAYVLPQDYAYGFRGPNDKIWGLWEADDISYSLSVGTHILLEKYGTHLDIIYEDALQAGGGNLGYNNITYWNDPDAVQEQWPDDSPTATATPTATLTPSPTPTLETSTPSPSPSVDPSQTPDPTPALSSSPTTSASSSFSPSEQPTATPPHRDSWFLSGGYIYGIAAGIGIAAVLAVLIVSRKLRKPTSA